MLPVLAIASALPSTSDPQSIGWVLVILFLLAQGALTVKNLLQRNPPLHREYVARAEHDQLVGKVDAMIAEMRQNRKEDAEASSKSRSKIYDLLREQTAQLARLENATETNTQQVGLLSHKIDQVARDTRSSKS